MWEIENDIETGEWTFPDADTPSMRCRLSKWVRRSSLMKAEKDSEEI